MKGLLFFLVTFFIFSGIKAQTPGLIIRDGNGVMPPSSKSTVLDPNQDGWSSVSTAGFSSSDIGAAYSEIPYKPIPPLFPEPTGDLRRGATGFFSEIVKADPGGTGFYIFFDAANSRILFRIRISGIISGSKGYSAQLETDGKFFGTSPSADPTYQAQTTGTNGNPGFEYEIVYETNFRIAVYDVNNSCNPLPPQLLWSVDLTSTSNSGYAQTSIALTTDSGNPDYFYDFWIPLSALSGGTAGPVTATTPLRVQATTIMSPQGAICGPVSDLYGDDALYGTSSSQYVATIQGQPSFTLNDVTSGGSGPGAVCTLPPIVNFPIASGATSVSGTWTKASYSPLTTATITVYKNSTAIGTASATSGGTWILTGISPALTNNDIITAKAQATGESICLSSNAVLILDCTPATSSSCPTVSCFTDKGAEGSGIPGATLRIYRMLSTGISVDFTLVIPADGAWGWAAAGSTGTATNVCNTGSKDLLDGTYYVTQQEPGKCESACLTPYCVGFTATTTPVITIDPVFTGTSSITGTAVAVSTVRLYLNNVLKATTTATGGNYSFPISGYYAQVGDVYTVTAQATGQCVSGSATKTVQCFVSNPIINTTEAGVLVAGNQITGKSSEPVGTTITVYNGATNAVIGSTSVIAGGNWALISPAAVSGTTYYARHTGTPCGASGASAIVSTLTGTSSGRCGTITGPINENAISVSGTLTGSFTSTLVTLYIDGAAIGTFSTNNTIWGPISVNTTYLNKIYPGGVLSIGLSESGRAEVICPNTLTVLCVPPSIPVLSNPAGTAGTTPGTLSYTITNSQAGILYIIEDDRTGALPTQTNGTDRGSSYFGNGSSLTLTTSVLPESGNYRFRISALKLTGTGCTQLVVTSDVNPYNSTTPVNDENSTWQDVNVSGSVVVNDFDVEKNTQIFGGFWNGSSYNNTGTIGVFATDGTTLAGSLIINNDGTYSFDPLPGFLGVMRVRYQICDNGNLAKCDTASLLITVSPTLANSLIANNDENVSYGAPVTSTVTANDDDPQPLDAFTVTALNGVSFTTSTTITVNGIDEFGNTVTNAGTLSIATNGTYTYTPAAGFYGSISVPYTITDNNITPASATAILYIDVLRDSNGPANDPPFGGDDFAATTLNTSVSGSVLVNDGDVNGNTLTVTPQTTTVAGGTLTLLANGTYTFVPTNQYVGPVVFYYQVCDGQSPNLCATAELHFLVSPVYALPVTGLELTARLNSSNTLLDWKTESEINSDHFVVERSIDNRSFIAVGTVAASGNTQTRRNYNFSDNISSLMTEKAIYYRIRQVDMDARFAFSNVAVVKLSQATGIKAWPNPFSGIITINITSEISTKVNIGLFAANGQLLQMQQQQVSRGTNQMNLRNLEALSQGIYLLQVTDNTGLILYSEKFIKN